MLADSFDYGVNEGTVCPETDKLAYFRKMRETKTPLPPSQKKVVLKPQFILSPG